MEPSGHSDERLALAAGAGDLTAFRELVERHKGYIFTLLFQMIGHRETAEDLSQEVFIKLHRALPQFRGEAKFSTWLYRIAANTVTDYKRSSVKNPILKLFRMGRDPTITPNTLSTHMSPEDRAVVKEGRELMQQLIRELPEKYKLILFLYYYKQLSIQEIALIVELPAKTVETRLLRGKAKLKDKWMEANPHEIRSAVE
ncbi:MAG: subunit sigma-24 of polymerase [Paenibacillus sp.]|jgi:RNA polymerase sigma-70 factor (ECF subfamily)|nr:subunit sigma-24 of polymerase [Paenibacillus sp.]